MDDSIPCYKLPSHEHQSRIRTPISEDLVARANSSLQQRFTALLQRDRVLANVCHKLRARGATATIFGGWVRDRIAELIHDRSFASRDIDLVVNGVDDLSSILGGSAIRNVFGGYGLATETTHLDIWQLRNTYLISKRKLPVEFETLPETADFGFNAVVFFPQEFFCSPKIFGRTAFDAIYDKVLSFQADELALPVVQVARVAIHAAKLGFTIDPEVSAFIRSICKDPEALSTAIDGIAKYSPPEFSARAVSTLLELVSK